MATTINANNTDGVVITPDTSGELELQANGVTKAKVTANGLQDANGNSLRGGSFRNLIINGDMKIDQRNAGSAVSTNFSFPVDRWTMYNSGGTFTAQQQTFTLGDAPDSRLQKYVRLTRSSPSGILYFTQKIEDVINSNNVTVTVSFYAKANTNITLPARLVQVFGSGGSTAVTVGSVNNNITNSWQKFTATFTCPSLSGKTIGTSSYLELTFDTPATYSTLDITGVQLEVGEGASDFEFLPYDVQLQRCQRYFQIIRYMYFGANTGTTITSWRGMLTYLTELRSAPTITYGTITSGFSIYNLLTTPEHLVFECGASARADFRPGVTTTTTISAEL